MLLNYNIYVLEDDENTINELNNYLYPIDKNDNILPENPIGPDHILDAFKYGLTLKGRLW